jgi:hypothetical protein
MKHFISPPHKSEVNDQYQTIDPSQISNLPNGPILQPTQALGKTKDAQTHLQSK